MADPRIVPFGDDALLVEVADLTAVRGLDDAVRAARQAGDAPWSDIVDQVPAARTVLLRTTHGADLTALAAAVAAVPVPYGPVPSVPVQSVPVPSVPVPSGPVPSVPVPAGCVPSRPVPSRPGAAPPGAGDVVHLDVVYDGEDLTEVAALTGCTVEEVVARHAAPTYTVAFGGFLPGFAYLVGLDPRLRVPRRDSPRERVPAGSVALADEHTAVYPAQSPGGWRLLGRCDAVLFDVTRTPPALLPPGTRVRFVPVRASAGAPARVPAGPCA